VKEGHDKCVAAMEKVNTTMMHDHECNKLMHTILREKDFEKNGKKMCLNMYDIRLTDTFPACGMNWPPEIHAITEFLGVCVFFLDFTNLDTHYFTQLPEVVSSLHAKAHPGGWVECKHMVHTAFRVYDTEASVSCATEAVEQDSGFVLCG
jgi:carboxypeptidase D